jgi:four helix bundle protein
MEYIYEKLEAWQDAVDFANQVITLLRETSRDWKNRDLLERAEESSANIAVAISRAKCSRTRDDIIQQLYLSRRSLYETMTLFEIFWKNKWISDHQYEYVRTESNRISASLINMMRGMNLFPAINPNLHKEQGIDLLQRWGESNR